VLGEDENAPPLRLYSTLKPDTAATLGRVNMAAQAFEGDVITGAKGNTTAYMVPSWHAAKELVELAGVNPHTDVSLYLALMVQHPAVFVSRLFAAVNVP